MDAFSPKNNSTIIPPVDPWKKYMPSKKIGIALLVILAVFLVYLFKDRIIVAINSITQKQIITTTIPVPIASTSNQPLSFEKDSDGDGLADWQETLIGSDPNDPDSIAEIPEEIKSLIEASSDVVPVSDKLALAIFERLKSDPTGRTGPEGLLAATAKETLDLADTIDAQLTTYTVKDLNLVDDTPETRAAYLQNISIVIQTISINESTFAQVHKNLLEGVATPNAAYQTRLAQNLKKLLEIPVPFKLAEQHLTYTNAISHIYESLQRTSDPLSQRSDETMNYIATLIFQKNFNLALKTAQGLVEIIQTTN